MASETPQIPPLLEPGKVVDRLARLDDRIGELRRHL
jgi:hypothetical protein